MEPILSVVVPSYNVEQYLDKCLTSFSDERFNNRLQVIIANDGSTDKTHDIALSYVEKFPGIFLLIDKENGGHGSAVNCGIDNARGKYFRIVDGDDWVNTENLVKLLELLETTDADLVIDEKREVNMTTGNTEFFPLPKDVDFGKNLNFSEICKRAELSPFIMLHTMSAKTSLLRENNIRLLEGIFYVDIEYIIKTTVRAKTIEFFDLEIYQYLVGNVNQSVNFRNYVKRYSHHLKVTKELVEFATNFDCDDVIRNYLDNRICLLLNTHYNICLIYNENRAEGLKWAKDFREYLKITNKKYFEATKKRYALTLVLHFLGIDYEKLQKIKR